jgi:HEXXH motif-containing protein
MATAILLCFLSMLTNLKLEPASLLPPFESSLPDILRLSGERALLERHSLTRDTYSTKCFLSGVYSKPDAILKTIPVGNKFRPHFEASSSELVHYCAQHDLKLVSDTDTANAIGLVQAALSGVIQPHPFLSSAVSELVWRCHIVRAQDEDYDVSFSDPAIPFSVFISTPAKNDRRSILRVAESLIHETMHLQLTLFEVCCPLVDSAFSWSMYSPWKRQERPAQGILHGLYVFHILRWMWQQVSLTARNEIDRDFALRRIIEINDEILSVRALENSPALTKSGNLFLRKLFAS